MEELAQKVLAGDTRAAARACRLVDDRGPGHRELLKYLLPSTGKALRLGLTGNPGSGKSSLADALVAHFRTLDKRVGVVAVDPSSPYTKGAILGDRIRLQRHFEDPEVFIRSVATRGALGGLSRSTDDVTAVMEAWGAEVILIETVGVGQDELDVTKLAHTVVVVVAPGLGDAVQAAKAGLYECADVFVVNKADLSGAAGTLRDLEGMIALSGERLLGHAPGHGPAETRTLPEPEPSSTWVPPVVSTVATRGTGIAELAADVDRHRAWLLGTPEGLAKRQERQRDHVRLVLTAALSDGVLEQLGAAFEEAVDRVVEGTEDVYVASDRLLALEMRNRKQRE